MQANGAEMMRLAACLATERGVEVCAPVHDAFLICAPLDRLDQDVATMRAAMAEASRIVLGGFELGTDVSITRWPDRYMDSRGRVMWERVMGLLDQSEQRQDRMTEDDPYADLKQHRHDARDAGDSWPSCRGKSRSGGSISSKSRGLGSSGSRMPATPPPTGWRCTYFIDTGRAAANPSRCPTV